MQSTRTSALRSAQQLFPRSHPRRLASSHASPPVKASFGTGTYVALSAIPFSYLLYNATRPSKDGKQAWLSEVIGHYTNYEEEYKRRNTLQTQALEGAAADRHLFLDSRPKQNLDLRFTEIFNVGSPYNVPAGHYANMDKVVERYQSDNARNEEERIARMDAREQRSQRMAEQQQEQQQR